MNNELLNKDLLEILSTVHFDENGGVRITGTDWYEDNLRIEFVITPGDSIKDQLWEVQINGVREDLIKSEFANKLELVEEHPLLWTYNQVGTELFFTKQTEKPDELFTSIYEIHMRETRGWLELHKFINKTISFKSLCRSNSGQFARGPVKLMEKYGDELSKHKMNPSFYGQHHPKRWTNDQWIEESEPMKALIIGRSYVVAENFDFKRV